MKPDPTADRVRRLVRANPNAHGNLTERNILALADLIDDAMQRVEGFGKSRELTDDQFEDLISSAAWLLWDKHGAADALTETIVNI